MRNVVRRTGRLHRLAVFEAAARLGSFTAASEELGIAQPAITRHIRSLEQSLGIELFVRGPNKSSLSEQGHILHLAVASGFATIEDGIAAAGSPLDSFVLACGPGIAQRLLPLLDDFDDMLGPVDLHLSIYDRETDLKMTSVDAAIRVGPGSWPGLESVFLCPEHVVPVASPELARQLGIGEATTAQELLHAPRVYMDEGDRTWLSWARWFGSFGLEVAPHRRRIVFNNYPLVLQHAIDGRGVALGWRALIDPLVESGTLSVVGPEVSVGNGFYLTFMPGPGAMLAQALGESIHAQMASGPPPTQTN